MLTGWRLVREKYAADAFSGEGARRFGGRWNSSGTAVVYTSATLSLAALELLVHLNPPAPMRYSAFRLEVMESLIERFPRTSLPVDWQSSPPPPAIQSLGDRWVQEGRSAVLAVPSVLIPGELNFLLNPSHPDFNKISIQKPEPFAFDPRLLS